MQEQDDASHGERTAAMFAPQSSRDRAARPGRRNVRAGIAAQASDDIE